MILRYNMIQILIFPDIHHISQKPSIALSVLAVSAFAQRGHFKSSITNNSNKTVVVDFTAQGCAGHKFGHDYVCNSQILPAGETAVYQFGKLNSIEDIHMGVMQKPSQNDISNDVSERSANRGNCYFTAKNDMVVNAISADDKINGKGKAPFVTCSVN